MLVLYQKRVLNPHTARRRRFANWKRLADFNSPAAPKMLNLAIANSLARSRVRQSNCKPFRAEFRLLTNRLSVVPFATGKLSGRHLRGKSRRHDVCPARIINQLYLLACRSRNCRENDGEFYDLALLAGPDTAHCLNMNRRKDLKCSIVPRNKLSWMKEKLKELTRELFLPSALINR